MSDPLVLTEYRMSARVELVDDELDRLYAILGPSLGVRPTIGTPGAYDLTPGSRVGTISLPNRAVTIRPKIGVGRMLFLMAYASDPHAWRDEPFDYAEEDLLEAVIPAFAAHLRRALGRGVLEGYRALEDDLLTVRGRIDIQRQVAYRFGRVPPVATRFDEFTQDIEENRILRAALAALAHLPLRSPTSRSTLAAYSAVLGNVSLVEFERNGIPTIVWTRLNRHYKPAVQLARVILRATAFDQGVGRVPASAFLVDMNRLFEDFVIAALRDQLGLRADEFPQGARGHALYLDRERRIRLRRRHLPVDARWLRVRRRRQVQDDQE